MSIDNIITFLLFATLIIILGYREYQYKKVLKRINQMLDEAITGIFTEKTYDESVLSKIEIRFASYLKAMEISYREVDIERDKIKELISDISHQTKTPISNLLLYTELLKEQNLPDDIGENIDSLYIQVERLSFLLESLIKISRLENGIIKLLPKERKINDLLDDIESQFRHIAEKKGLNLEIESCDYSAVYDLKWTVEAVGNILDNAVKYTESGKIGISTKSYEFFIRIDIVDTGIGVCEEEQEKIFLRFYRSNNVRDKNGLGIGLYLSREILSQQGGYIKVSRNGKKGSIFSIFIPKV